MHIDAHTGFIPNGAAAMPPRPLHIELMPTILHHIHNLWSKSIGIFVPTDSISEEDKKKIHNNCVHWEKKPNKPAGRLIIEASTIAPEFGTALNSGDAREKSIQRYSKLNYCTIESITDCAVVEL